MPKYYIGCAEVATSQAILKYIKSLGVKEYCFVHGGGVVLNLQYGAEPDWYEIEEKVKQEFADTTLHFY